MHHAIWAKLVRASRQRQRTGSWRGWSGKTSRLLQPSTIARCSILAFWWLVRGQGDLWRRQTSVAERRRWAWWWAGRWTCTCRSALRRSEYLRMGRKGCSRHKHSRPRLTRTWSLRTRPKNWRSRQAEEFERISSIWNSSSSSPTATPPKPCASPLSVFFGSWRS